MDSKRRKEEYRELMAERLRLGRELMAERLRLGTTNFEPSHAGTLADPNVADAFENKESEQASAAIDDLDSFENSLRFSDKSEQSEQLSVSEDSPDSIGGNDSSDNIEDNDSPDKIEGNDDFFLESQEANNISKAAYKELMTMAVEANTWVVATPALGSLEEFVQMFRSAPPPGKRVDCSIQSADVPVAPDFLVSIMMDVDRWALFLSHVVYRESVQVPPKLLLKLKNLDATIESILLVNAEFQLPTPLVQSRKFCFFRCLRNILPNVWAIVDISSDYFPGVVVSGSGNMCRRRPSGLVVREYGSYSQVIWIENVEIPECQSKDDIYSGLVNSNLAFSAKRWVDALISKLKRNYSRFLTVKMKVNRRGCAADNQLLNLTETMREHFIDIVSETTDEERWVTLSNKDVRILRNSPDHVDSVGSISYIAVTSFRLQAKPMSVIDLLVKKNVDIQWPRLLNMEEPEEVIRFASESNCITLHKKVFFQDESTQDLEYLLQEASSDGFCFFVTSTPISKLDVDIALLVGSSGVVPVQPSGFAIMPDGPDGFHSNASLVTVAFQQQLAVPDTDQAIPIMCDLINAIIKEISEEVCKGSSSASS